MNRIGMINAITAAAPTDWNISLLTKSSAEIMKQCIDLWRKYRRHGSAASNSISFEFNKTEILMNGLSEYSRINQVTYSNIHMMIDGNDGGKIDDIVIEKLIPWEPVANIGWFNNHYAETDYESLILENQEIMEY